MFRHTIPMGRIFGIPIELDYSWFLIAVLITWLLAASYYPTEFPGSPRSEYWLMGAVTAVLFFASIIIHELAHSLVALRYRIPINRITLFIFGGVSQIAGEPPSASAEFLIAAAGPATSIALAGVFHALETPLQGAPALVAVAKYLSFINLALGFFNLVPGFPLDGGRVFRAIVWGANRNFRRATSIAAQTGRFFGFLFIMLGVWQVFAGRVGNGLWIAFIGWFLESAASAQVQQQMAQGLLVGHYVSEAMNPTCARVPADASLQELVDEQVLGRGVRCFLVVQGDEVVGLLTLHSFKAAPRSAWNRITAREVMVPLQKAEKIDPHAELWTALQKMGRDGMNQLPVASGDRIVGLLTRSDIVNYLQTLAQIDGR